jgi:hypothetical protein
MPNQEEVSQWSQSVKTRLHILAYISAFIFLYIEGGTLSNSLIQAVGFSFLVPAFLILIGQFRVLVLKRIAKFTDDIFSLPMYLIAITVFITEVVDWVNFTEQVEWIWVIPIALLGIIVYDVITIIKNARALAREIGKKAAAIKQLKILSFVIVYFVLAILAFDVQVIGKPIFWLSPAAISLSIVLFLDGTFKK